MVFHLEREKTTGNYALNLSEGRIMGGEGVHIVETRMFCTLLKIILSADLLPFLKLGSITNSHTSNPNSERGKNWSKTMEKQKNTPCHLSSFSSDPLMGRNFLLFFCFLEVFATLAQKCPKTHGKKKKTFRPMSPVQLLLRPSPWVETFFFSRFLQLCQSNNISRTISVAHFLCFLVFLFLGLLGEIFTLTNIHWHSFHPSTFYTDFFIELLMLATEPSETIYSKNSFITHLFRHSIGLMFYWYAEVLAPHI